MKNRVVGDGTALGFVVGMTPPREVLPGRFLMITRRCSQRQFLLRPDSVIGQAFLYCLAIAAQRCGVDVIVTCVMSNHVHTVIYDREGRVSEFMGLCHGMFAECVNAIRGRTENVWSSDGPSVVHLVRREDVLAKVVYAATNPVLDGLVEKVHHWPGVNGLAALLGGQSIEVSRPRCYFAADGEMPERVTLRIGFPPELGEAELLCGAVRELVALVEERQALSRRRTGRRVIGRRGVLQQSWRATPETVEERGGLRPTVACRSVWHRIETLQRKRPFVVAYRRARAALLAGAPIPFPPGTYYLRRFVGVSVEPLPS